MNTKITKTPYIHHKQILKVFSYQFPDSLASACFLCSAVIYSQASKIFTIIKVCWTVFAFTHIRPFIPITSSNGYNCDNSWIISHLGAKSLWTRPKQSQRKKHSQLQTPHYYWLVTPAVLLLWERLKKHWKMIKVH